MEWSQNPWVWLKQKKLTTWPQAMGVGAVWAGIPKGVGPSERQEHDGKAACGRGLHCTVPRRCQKHWESPFSHLGCHGVGPGGEELCNTGRVKPCLREAKCSSQACPSSANHHCIKFMIHYWVLCRNLEKKNSPVNHPFNYAEHGDCSYSERA